MKRALFTLLLLGACTGKRTEVLITVSTQDLTVPKDFDAVRIIVTDASQAGAAPVYDSARTLICSATVTSGCQNLPLTVTLIPGPKDPEDSVRIEVQALLGTATVIDDAATFAFIKGQSQELDFVLYPACIQKDCATQNETCDATGTCTTIVPAPLGSADFAVATNTPDAHVGDLGPGDMTMSSGGGDMADASERQDMTSMRSCGELTLAGGTDGITLPNKTAYNFPLTGTYPGSFTLEMWIKPTAFPLNPGDRADLIAHAGSYEVWLDSGGNVNFTVTNDGTTWSTIAGNGQILIVPGNWYHVAVSFNADGGSHEITLWVQGREVANTTVTGSYSNVFSVSSPLTIGNYTDGMRPYQGSIDELMISADHHYSGMSQFTPPTLLTPNASTIGLFHLNDIGKTVTDSSATPNDGTLSGNAVLDDHCVPRLCDYASIPGNTFLLTANSADFYPTGSWTLEAWFFPLSGGAPQYSRPLLAYDRSYGMSFADSGDPFFYIPQIATTCPDNTQYSVNAGQHVNGLTWHHLAGVFDSSKKTLTLFVDGVLQGTATLDCSVVVTPNAGPANTPLQIIPNGSSPGVDIREVRISNVARYSASFTPATRFVSDANTIGLYHMDDLPTSLTAADDVLPPLMPHTAGPGTGSAGLTFDQTCL